MSRNLQRQMNMLDIPTGDLGAFKREGGKIKLYDSGGGGAASTQTQTTDLPDWAKPYAKNILAKGEDLTDINKNPYQTYGADRTADFGALQRQAMEGARTMGPAPQLGAATGLAGAAGLGALGTSYQPGQFYGGTFGNRAAEQYMNPYMQNVVDIQQREAQRQADIAGTQRGAQAVKSGAFGGSRQAITDAEAARNLALQKGDIQAQGLNTAFQQAQAQFNADQARRMQAQQLGEQSRQYGAGLGLQGLQTGLQAAGTLGQLGGQQFQQGLDINKLQSAYGGMEQAQRQRGLDIAYQDFLNQQNYPYKQLGFMSDLLRGTPTGSSSVTQMYQPEGSALGQLAGLGTGIYGLSKFMADGGEVNSYAEGGVTSQGNVENILSKLSDQQLAAARQAAMNRRDVGQLQLIESELAERASLRNGLGNAFDQIPQDRQEAMMAGGGIVAFADEGAVDLEKIQRERDRAALAQAYEDFKKGARKTGAAAMDIGTMPFRGLAGAAESVVTRPLRALGLDIPYLPESYYGGDASSMTPYMDKLRREEGVASTSSGTANKPQPKGAGARSTPVQIAPDVAPPKVKEKSQRISPTMDKAITKMAEQQGVPKDDFMDMFDRFRDKLQTESKEDLKGLQDLIDKQSGKSKEIKEKALGKALAEFGFAMAAKAAEPGARFTGSAAKASPTLSASLAESKKLAAAADENDIKMQIEMRKFSIASRKNDSATAMSAAQNMRILQQQQETIKQQQRQLDETIRHNMKTENLMGARIGASGNAYNTALLRTKSNLAVNAQKQAAKDWSDPLKGRELKTQYPSQKSYEKSLFNDMWSNAMPQLELIGTKSAED